MKKKRHKNKIVLAILKNNKLSLKAIFYRKIRSSSAKKMLFQII